MVKLIDSIEVLLFLSIPEVFFMFWLAFLVAGVRTRRLVPRVFKAAVIVSALQALLFLSLPTYIYIVYSFVVIFTVLYVVFRELRMRTRLLLGILAPILGVVLELVIVLFVSQFIEPLLMRTGPVIYKIMYVWPVFAAMGILCLLLSRKRMFPGLRIARYVNSVKDTSILSYLALLLLQFMVLISYVVVTFLNPNEDAANVFFVMGAATVIVVPISALHFLTRAKREAVASTRAAYLGDLLSMLDAIRRQRHDFINHVQVMYAMLGMNRTDRLAEYMRQVVEDIDQIGGFADSVPIEALSSLLAAKAAFASERGISFSASTPERMEGLDPLYITDLVRVTGCLTDLSFEQAMEHHKDKRIVDLAIGERDGGYAVTVTAPGGVIPAPERGGNSQHALLWDLTKKYRGQFGIEDGETVVYTAVLPLPK